MLRPSGPRQRRLRRAFRPQPAPLTPATGCPLGPLPGACESQHEATPVAIGRPGHHRPGLCCVVVLSCCRVVDAGPKPTASAPAQPLHPAAGARGHGPCRPNWDARNKTSTLRYTPLARPRALRPARRPAQLHARKSRKDITCAIAIGSGAGPARTGRPGLGPADARLLRWRGVLQPPSRKQAGPRVPLNRIYYQSVPVALLHSRLSRLAPSVISQNFLRSSL